MRSLPAAYALQGHALIYRSRQQPSSDARKADLDKALAQCKAAVDKSKAEDKERSMHLLYLSMAQLERANFDSDPKVKKELLNQAVANAQQAVDLGKSISRLRLHGTGKCPGRCGVAGRRRPGEELSGGDWMLFRKRSTAIPRHRRR